MVDSAQQGSLREALHLTHVWAEVLERQLVDHPALVADAGLRAQAEDVVLALADLHEMIGAKAGEA